MSNYDVVIRNGFIVDGSGLPGYRADVAITGDRIAKIGRIDESGATEIDASGHVVSPGFVDLHTHMDAQVFWDPLGASACWHGVTTVMMGNCGFTLAPARNDARLLAVRNIERAEAIERRVMEAGIDWTWETFPEYLDAVEAQPKGINYAALVGHSALRCWVMGEEAFTREANAEEVAEMEAILDDALAAGAWGLSTSRNVAHLTVEGEPVASRLSSWEEMTALVEVMGRRGVGLFEIAPEAATFSRERDERDEYHQRVLDLAATTGVTTLFGIVPNKPASDEQLALLDDAAAAGGRLFGLSHSRGITIVLSFQTQLPFDRLPTWKPIRALPHDEQLAALRDPDTVAALVKAAHEESYGTAAGAEARRPNYGRLYVMDRPVGPYETVAEVAERRGIDPVEAIIALAIETDLQQMFVQPTSRFDEPDLLEVLRHPRAIMTFSDSGAHVNQIMDSSIHTHLLAYWVRERQAIVLEEAVRMITLAPAIVGGFTDRGLLRPGMIADINIFDPATIGPRMPVAVNDLPAGGQRLVQYADGFLATLVAGEVVISDGEHTGALPGRLIRAS